MSHPVDELTAYLDGALAPAERSAVEAHLASCPNCRAERDRLAGALAALSRLPAAPEPSPTFEARFHARLAQERAAADERRGVLDRLRWRWLAPALAGAAATVAVVAYRGSHRAHEVFIAEHLELFESYEAVASVGALEKPGDLEVVAHLDELGGRP